MLYVVATPIGTLSDISAHALEILRRASIIACEDTRTTKKLLNHYGITTSCVRCDSHNEERTFSIMLLPALQRGEDVALVSDAGTPGISDPGALVVQHARDNDIEVSPIPGACSVSAVISVAGLHGKGFHFEGFLQRKSGVRRARLQELIDRNEAFVIFESPYRIAKLLTEIADIHNRRNVLLAREVTKKFEQFLRGSAQEVLQMWTHNPGKAKGECTLLVYPSKKS